MELPDSMEKQAELQSVELAKKFTPSAEKYASQGFDENSVCDLLQVDGCPAKLAKKIAFASTCDLPYMYAEDVPPASVEDVRDSIKEAILKASKEDLDEYFNKYAGNRYNGIVNRILIARDNEGIYVSEVIQELEPLVDDLIVTNTALASDMKVANSVDDKERLEQKLFGIWPAHLIRERSNIDVGDKKVISKSKVIPGKISLI